MLQRFLPILFFTTLAVPGALAQAAPRFHETPPAPMPPHQEPPAMQDVMRRSEEMERRAHELMERGDRAQAAKQMIEVWSLRLKAFSEMDANKMDPHRTEMGKAQARKKAMDEDVAVENTVRQIQELKNQANEYEQWAREAKKAGRAAEAEKFAAEAERSNERARAAKEELRDYKEREMGKPALAVKPAHPMYEKEMEKARLEKERAEVAEKRAEAVREPREPRAPRDPNVVERKRVAEPVIVETPRARVAVTPGGLDPHEIDSLRSQIADLRKELERLRASLERTERR